MTRTLPSGEFQGSKVLFVGDDLLRLEIARLRDTLLWEVAQVIGPRPFTDAAVTIRSQRLGIRSRAAPSGGPTAIWRGPTTSSAF